MTLENNGDTAAAANATPTPSAPTPQANSQAAPTPTPAAPTPAADPNNPTPTPTPAATEYKVPDAYKDKAWSAKIKTEDDVYKQLDNLNTLVGKKVINPNDLPNRTPEERAEFYNQLRPADKGVYKFADDVPAEWQGEYRNMLHDAGVSEDQAQKLVPAFEKFSAGELAKAYSKESFATELEKSFGKDFDAPAASAGREFKSHLSEDDKTLLEEVPNRFLGLMYRFTNNLQKAYGIKDTGAAANDGNSGSTPPDMAKQRSDKRAEINALESRSHTAEEKAKLVKELDAMYR